jgi:Ca-activated chloride channel family protein
MTFLWPSMLLFLLAVPLLVAFYIWTQRKRSRMLATYGGFEPAQQGATGPGRGARVRRHIPPILFLMGLLILIVAMARPQMVVSLPKLEGVVILAFDTSGSMAADDMSPTRMEAAKKVSHDFMARQPATIQVGVVAFSDSGFSVQPPTNNAKAVFDALARLQPQRSTSLGNGIQVSLDTIAKFTGQAPEDSGDFAPELLPTPASVPPGSFSQAVIVLISDGENTSNPDPLIAAQEAARRGVRIYTIGVGSPNGATLKIDGLNIHTQPDESMLRQISEITGGVYYNAATEEDMRAIYDQIEPHFIVKREKTEITSILAGISILVLMAGGFLSMLWFGRVP